MNKPNPFMQPGSLQDQKERKRARFRLAVYSAFGGTTLLMLLFLIQGCNNKAPSDSTGLDLGKPAEDTNMVSTNVAPDTNVVPQLATMGTNGAPAGTNAMQAPYVAPVQQPVTPPVVAEPTTGTYVITKGDSYYTIAKKLGVKMSEIKAANPNVNPNKLKVGQKINVPDKSGTGAAAPAASGASVSTGAEVSSETYTVKSGDNLMKIAKANGMTLKSLRALNSLKTDKIKVGQKLKIASKAAPAEPATMAPAAALRPVPETSPIPTAPATTAPAGTGH